VALAVTRIVQSILRNENAVVTVSTFLEDYHGVNDICLSVPAVLNRTGVKEVIKLPLEEKEITDFRNSASLIRKVIESLHR
jgi:L-lactate dehydrogenase